MTYYIVAIQFNFNGRDIMDIIHNTQRRNNKEEAIELALFYRRQFPNAKITLNEITQTEMYF